MMGCENRIAVDGSEQERLLAGAAVSYNGHPNDEPQTRLPETLMTIIAYDLGTGGNKASL